MMVRKDRVMENGRITKTRSLIDKGVIIPFPAEVSIGDDVNPGMIAPGVVIHPGCRISGKTTSIQAGTVLGVQGPVTLTDCQTGRDVELGGGFFSRSVFLDRSAVAADAHVRDACILEEEAGAAHSVKLGHSVLLPFVNLGSHIDFCDCLMAGGTDARNHSEVGSSFVHFNLTPNRDRAAPSLLGDVPRGVMQGERPIFLGGQGGLVGPAVIEYGTVTSAGTIVRGDITEGGKMVFDDHPRPALRNFRPGIYWEITRRVRNNLLFIANLVALRAWYVFVRSEFFGSGAGEQALLRGALEKLDMSLDERIGRLGEMAGNMPESIREYQALMGKAARRTLVAQERELFEKWGRMSGMLRSLKSCTGDEQDRDAFLSRLASGTEDGRDYIETVGGLDAETRRSGIRWLQGVVDMVVDSVYATIPSFR